MAQRKPLYLDDGSGHQGFDELVEADLPDLSVTYATLAALFAYAQPLDSDLTAIALLTTTNFGRSLLALSNASAARTALALGTAAQSATTAFDAAGDAAAAQAAAEAYADSLVTGLLDFKGATDASGNPNYPAALKGDAYVVSVAGKIGGASGTSVAVGDLYVASADNAGGTQAGVGPNWFVLEHNLVGALLAANNLSDLANAGTARTNLGLGTAAVAATGDFDAAGAAAAAQSAAATDATTKANAAQAAAIAASQPLDSDLTAVAALAPSDDDVIQRKAGAWTNRTMAQLIADLAALATTFQPLDADLTSIAGLSTTAFGRALLALADPADATKFLNGSGAFSVPSSGGATWISSAKWGL